MFTTKTLTIVQRLAAFDYYCLTNNNANITTRVNRTKFNLLDVDEINYVYFQQTYDGYKRGRGRRRRSNRTLDITALPSYII